MNHHLSILIVDDEKNICQSLSEFLSLHGFNVDFVLNAQDALTKLSNNRYQVVITDYKMPNVDGYALSKQIKTSYPSIQIIIMTAFGRIEDAVEIIKHGIYDYLTKPLNTDVLLKKLTQIETDIGSHHTNETFDDALLNSKTSNLIYEFSQKAAKSENTVLLTGETGTGKTELGKKIHLISARKDNPFVYVNCAAISPNLIESALFGHIKGAYTGADQKRSGKLMSAHKGTLFLDEIGSASLDFQAKLLNVLQHKTFEPVGSDTPISVDVRFIAATNTDLEEAIKNRQFRSDLFFRLKILHLELPPLKTRKEDIAALTRHFIKKHPMGHGRSFSDNAITAMTHYAWPGNIRELENVVWSLLDMTDKEIIDETHLPFLTDTPHDAILQTQGLSSVRSQAEAEIISKALLKHNGNILLTAKELSIHERSLRRKMKLYGFDKKNFKRH